MNTNSPTAQESTGKHRIRQQLIALGLRPREAEARASIAKRRLTDFRGRGGVAL